MGFRIRITGASEPIELDERSITKVDFSSVSPQDSGARATDYVLSARVWGKMLYRPGGGDPTLALERWARMPSEKADCYRHAEITVVSAGQIVRRFLFPDAFVVEYSEEGGDQSGVGQFYLHIKQRKDENASALITGGLQEAKAGRIGNVIYGIGRRRGKL